MQTFPQSQEPLNTEEDDDDVYTDEDSWNDWSQYSDEDDDDDSLSDEDDE
ncbi:MAG: hypothetical protein Q4F00_06865 [bacterium]|nr:hypothetical protein [bacterium]